jgi:hypothetical protein
MSFAKPINPLILDELRRLKSVQGEVLTAKAAPDRFERLVAEVTSATLRRLADLQVQLQA